MAKNIKTKQGFTIIEVVLVLAIAGLIFLMVFVALPQLQRSQRDTQRRQDLSRVVTALVQYQTNNRTKRNNLPPAGKFVAPNIEDGATEAYPSDCNSNSACSFVKNYMNTAVANDSGERVNVFDDPDGVPYNVLITANMAAANATDFAASLVFNDESKMELAASDAGNEYTIGGTNPYSQHVVYIVPGGTCSGENVVKDELRHFAILYQLEGSGIYCVGSDSN